MWQDLNQWHSLLYYSKAPFKATSSTSFPNKPNLKRKIPICWRKLHPIYCVNTTVVEKLASTLNEGICSRILSSEKLAAKQEKKPILKRNSEREQIMGFVSATAKVFRIRREQPTVVFKGKELLV